MRHWKWAAVPSGAVLILAVAGWALFREPVPPRPEVVSEASFETLGDAPWVRLKGTAHYRATITQREAATLFREERTLYVFPFFPVNETADRAIPVLVRAARPPERLVAYETMVVEGRLRPPTRDVLPPQTEGSLSEKTGYFFADGLWVLDATRIESEDGVWTAE